MSVTYTRNIPIWVAPAGKGASSANYWRSQARAIFARWPHVHRIIISTHKSELIDAGLIQRGHITPVHPGDYLIRRSSSGKWGKPRRNYFHIPESVTFND